MLFRPVEISEWEWFFAFYDFLHVEFFYKKKIKKLEIGLMTSITLLLSTSLGSFLDDKRQQIPNLYGLLLVASANDLLLS